MRPTTQSSSEQDKKRRESDQNEERKRDSTWSHVIKTVTVNQSTTDLNVVLKTGYRQTDRQTKYMFTVWQALSFQSRENTNVQWQQILFLLKFIY